MTVTRRAWVHPISKLTLGHITTVTMDDGRYASHYGWPMSDEEAINWSVDQLEAPED